MGNFEECLVKYRNGLPAGHPGLDKCYLDEVIVNCQQAYEPEDGTWVNPISDVFNYYLEWTLSEGMVERIAMYEDGYEY